MTTIQQIRGLSCKVKSWVPVTIIDVDPQSRDLYIKASPSASILTFNKQEVDKSGINIIASTNVTLNFE